MNTKILLPFLTLAFTSSIYAEMSMTIDGDYRKFHTDSMPSYTVVGFPGKCNPNTASQQNIDVQVPINPVYQDETTPLVTPNKYGIMVDGVIIEPNADEYWSETDSSLCTENDGHTKNQWAYAPLSNLIDLGFDSSHAHVQPGGLYHYHGRPTNLLKTLDLTKVPIIGYAADGFPIYSSMGYKDPLNMKSGLVTLKSSYRIKKGARPIVSGGPNGDYDGRFESDYEYIADAGDLDECNGRKGVTPDYPNGTYYYVITSDYPWVGRCFHGKPDDSFQLESPGKGGRPPRNGSDQGPPPPKQ